MLTTEDIQNLIKAQKEVFATRDDFEGMREDFSKLQTSIDTYSKKADTYFQEMVLLSHKIDRHEKWLQQVADKLNLKLEY